jgi:hypothetical protein
MKKIGLLILFILLSACSVAVIEEPFVPPVVEVPVIEEVITEEIPPIEEDLIVEEPVMEKPSIVIPEGATVVITKIDLAKDILDGLLEVEEYFIFDELVFEYVEPASHIVLIYEDELIKETPPLSFGVAELTPMDVAVRHIQGKTFSLIYPASTTHAESFLELLQHDDIHQVGKQMVRYQPIIDEIYPFMTKYGRVGVLTELAKPGESVPFLPRGTHQVFNDASSFFAADLDTRVIFYPHDNDLGYSPSRFGKRIDRGDVEGFIDNNGIRTILIRERFHERIEWFFLSYEVLGLEGKFNSRQITDLFEYNGPYYRGARLNFQTRPFIPRDVPFLGMLSEINQFTAPLDLCRIQQTNRRANNFGHPDINDNHGFPMLYNVPPSGDVNIAIVAIDFPDVPGEEQYLPIYLSQVDTFIEWGHFVSDGQLNYVIQFPDRWIRAPREAKYYTRMGGVQMDMTRPDAIATQPFEESVRQLVVAADDFVDWSVIDFVQFVFPIASHVYAVDLQGPVFNLYSPNAGFVSFWAWGAAYEQFRPDSPDPAFRTLWDWIVHEVVHYQGLGGHGPLNGSHYSIMMNQHGQSKALLAWESFLMGFFDEQHIACIDPDTIDQPIHLQLDSLDQKGGAPGLKSVMIPVGEFEIVVVEYRTDGPFSTLSPEFHGFTAYYIDVDGERVRCDWCDPILMEQQNFWHYLRNATETLECDRGLMPGSPTCGHPSVVQYPGHHLDFFGVRLEFFNDGVLSIRKLY